MDEKIIYVDEEDKVLGSKSREDVDKEGLRYRVSALWIKNSNGASLLARRAYSKSHNPGKWGPAVAGTVEEGETYESNIIKEAEEELGIRNVGMNVERKEKIEEGGHRFFTQWFTCIVDRPVSEFKIQEEEVAEVRWFSKEELYRMIREGPENFIPNMKGRIESIYGKGNAVF